MDDKLRDLAEKWAKSGQQARGQKGREDVGTALIGCAQALIAVLDEENSE